MSVYDVKGVLAEAVANDETQVLQLPVPQDGADYIVVYRIAGTFVGTIQAQARTTGAYAGIATVPLGATGTVAAADPTAVGNYSAPAGAGATWVRFVFSAYTSGEATIEATLVKVSA